MLYPMRPVKPITLPLTPYSYWVQPKFNGWALVLPGDGTVWTRRGNEITDWPCFAGLSLRFFFPIHAELCVVGGVSSDVSTLRRQRQDRVFYIAVHDAMIEGLRIEERLQHLRKLRLESPFLLARTVDFFTWEEVNDAVSDCIAQGDEGVVLKQKNSPYYIGRLSSIELPIWYKIKQPIRLEKPC